MQGDMPAKWDDSLDETPVGIKIRGPTKVGDKVESDAPDASFVELSDLEICRVVVDHGDA